MGAFILFFRQIRIFVAILSWIRVIGNSFYMETRALVTK